MGNICCEENTEQRTTTITKNKKVIRSRKSDSSVKETPLQIDESIKAPEISQKSIGGIKRHGAQKYQSIKFLGRGTFGNVVLAEDKQNHNQYAMKIIDKRKIKQFNVLQCQLIRKISEQQLFVSIRETFQNQNLIYLVMQYLQRGDIYFYLRRKQCIFTEQIIKNLAAQIIVGIQLLHKSGIIYRELKPENILVTDDGHIKLTDYGLSKMIVEDKTSISTFVGTLQYTAPEALKGNYGKQVDLWALGTLMFELRFQKNPFEPTQIENSETIQKNIEKNKIQDILNELVGLISHDFRDILIRLLEKDPTKRITIQQIKQHRFFSGIDWDEITLRHNQPPLKQFVQNDHIKFRDPTNEIEIAHRKIIQNKNREFKTNLYQFRSSQ